MTNADEVEEAVRVLLCRLMNRVFGSIGDAYVFIPHIDGGVFIAEGLLKVGFVFGLINCFALGGNVLCSEGGAKILLRSWDTTPCKT